MHSGYVILATITAICFAFYTGLQYVSETQPGYSIVIDFDSFYEGAINSKYLQIKLQFEVQSVQNVLSIIKSKNWKPLTFYA
jgi:hypothetical protein